MQLQSDIYVCGGLTVCREHGLRDQGTQKTRGGVCILNRARGEEEKLFDDCLHCPAGSLDDHVVDNDRWVPITWGAHWALLI